ncbi:MAG: phosphoribosylglycinamide formyltransferase [Chitinophagaceae bacterium]
MKTQLAIFASGNGSNAQAIMDACKQGIINANVAVIITDKSTAFVIERAKKENIGYRVFKPKIFVDKAQYETAILQTLNEFKIDFIVLAGYMRLIGTVLLQAFPKKIVNIHPSLLPKYKGLNAVQQALDNNDKELGVTIHYVDEGMDTGEIIAQEKITIEDLNESLDEIMQKVHNIEHKLYVETLKRILNYKL